MVEPTNGWIRFEGEDLPQNVGEYFEKEGAFEYHGQWITGSAFYKKLEDPKTWILVTDNGGFFKVDAEWMIWYPREGKDLGAQAIWSVKALKNSLESLFKTGNTVPDPGYQT